MQRPSKSFQSLVRIRQLARDQAAKLRGESLLQVQTLENQLSVLEEKVADFRSDEESSASDGVPASLEAGEYHEREGYLANLEDTIEECLRLLDAAVQSDRERLQHLTQAQQQLDMVSKLEDRRRDQRRAADLRIEQREVDDQLSWRHAG